MENDATTNGGLVSSTFYKNQTKMHAYYTFQNKTIFNNFIPTICSVNGATTVLVVHRKQFIGSNYFVRLSCHDS